MIIAIAGEAEAGKDSIGILIDELWAEKNYKGSKTTGRMNAVFYDSFQHIKFADGINKTLAAFTKLPLEYILNKDNYTKPIKWLGDKTLRTVKNEIGEGFKKYFGEEVWCKSSFTNVSPDANVRITDFRFPIEQRFLFSKKAITILVVRPGYKAETLTDENRNAISEQIHLLDKELINHIIINDGDRNQLKTRVKEALETHEEWNNPVRVQNF